MNRKLREKVRKESCGNKENENKRDFHENKKDFHGNKRDFYENKIDFHEKTQRIPKEMLLLEKIENIRSHLNSLISQKLAKSSKKKKFVSKPMFQFFFSSF